MAEVTPHGGAVWLDRMAIEDVGANPERLAAAIHIQLGLETGSVPVHSIAMALDIQEIRTEPLHNIEGALITTQERGVGSILVNRNSSRQRRRFTMAHERGIHSETSSQQTACTASPVQSSGATVEQRVASSAGCQACAALHRFPSPCGEGLVWGEPRMPRLPPGDPPAG